jgi:dihydrolipoamide dehydrogenase
MMPDNNPNRYDASVMGGGIAGLPTTLKLGFKDFTVALVERDKLGGTYLNRGGNPSKTMTASTQVAYGRKV